MNKQELVEQIAAEAGIPKKAAEAAVTAFTSIVEKEVCQGREVKLVGFGTFCSVERNARKGRNPQTGGEVVVAARRVPKFSAGKALKDACSSKK